MPIPKQTPFPEWQERESTPMQVLQSPVDASEKLFEISLDHHQKGRVAEAVEGYNRLIQIQPGHIAALYNLGNIYRQWGDVERAVSCFRKGLVHSPKNVNLLLELGNTLHQASLNLEAIASYERVIAIQPHNIKAHFNLAVVHRCVNNIEAAMHHFEEAAATHPENAVIHVELGNTYFLAGKLQRAIDSYKNALAIDPDTPNARLRLGMILRQTGQMDQAIEHFHLGSRLYSEDETFRFEMANTYYLASSFENAIRHYQAAIDIKPDYYEACCNLGNAYRQVQDYGQAIVFHQRADALRPNRPEILYQLGHSCYDTGEYRDALNWYHKAVMGGSESVGQGPLRIRIETSSACNLRCQHCPTGLNYQRGNRGIMGMKLFHHILEQMRNMPFLQDCVLYLGGEPLLNKNLATMCRLVKEQTPVKYTLFNTNAMLISNEICDELSQSGVDIIEISIDGHSPEENDFIRRGSKYDLIVRNVSMLRDRLPDTRIIIANTIVRRPGDPPEPEPPDFLRKDFPGLAINSHYAMKWPGFDSSKSALTNLGTAVECAREYCRKPFTEMVVRENGDVVLCCYDILGQHVVGNALSQSLIEIWQENFYQKLRNNMVQNRLEHLPKICQNCKIYTGETLYTISENQ